jgi:peptide deformylase
MLNHNGIGLAANQLNIKKRVFAIGSKNVPGFPEPFCVFNPVILEASEEQVLDKEGCLSFPGLWLHLQRPKMIVAQYQNSKGETKEAKVEGYLAKCFQHELDHLNGICFVDKVSRLKLQLAMKKLKKRQK